MIALASNRRRYSFIYDALNARFSMSIDNVQSDDAGVWRCEVMYRRVNVDNEQLAIDVRELRVTGGSTRPSLAHMPVPIRSIDLLHTSASPFLPSPRRATPSPPQHTYENLFNQQPPRDLPVTYAHVDARDRENIVKFERVFGKHARRPVARHERYNGGGCTVLQRCTADVLTATIAMILLVFHQ